VTTILELGPVYYDHTIRSFLLPESSFGQRKNLSSSLPPEATRTAIDHLARSTRRVFFEATGRFQRGIRGLERTSPPKVDGEREGGSSELMDDWMVFSDGRSLLCRPPLALFAAAAHRVGNGGGGRHRCFRAFLLLPGHVYAYTVHQKQHTTSARHRKRRKKNKPNLCEIVSTSNTLKLTQRLVTSNKSTLGYLCRPSIDSTQ
jgi:hypothetical protein